MCWGTCALGGSLHVKVDIAPDITDILYHVEAVLLAAMEPPLNLQRGKFGRAERFVQHRNPDLPPTEAEMTAEILEMVRKLSTKQ